MAMSAPTRSAQLKDISNLPAAQNVAAPPQTGGSQRPLPSSQVDNQSSPLKHVQVPAPVSANNASTAGNSPRRTSSSTITTTSAPSLPIPLPSAPNSTAPQKLSPKDYIFGKVLGEGSFSTVYLAKDVHHSKEYAIKVCEKRELLREKKAKYVMREKEVLNILNSNQNMTAPFFVKLYGTFQNADNLYFVLSYAKHGELLPYINNVDSFDITCTRFYGAEILRALEHLHSLEIIHRDLKPENILLDERMHIQITDFGSAKILQQPSVPQGGQRPQQSRQRQKSFVGTAQYISPELLTGKFVSKSSDLWALGCIVYQMVAGLPPFVASCDYLIFQKIINLEYEIPDGFEPNAKDLVQQLLALDATNRLGAKDVGNYKSIRSHHFFNVIDFETLHKQTPPQIYPYVPGTSKNEPLKSH